MQIVFLLCQYVFKVVLLCQYILKGQHLASHKHYDSASEFSVLLKISFGDLWKFANRTDGGPRFKLIQFRIAITTPEINLFGLLAISGNFWQAAKTA